MAAGLWLPERRRWTVVEETERRWWRYDALGSFCLNSRRSKLIWSQLGQNRVVNRTADLQQNGWKRTEWGRCSGLVKVRVSARPGWISVGMKPEQRCVSGSRLLSSARITPAAPAAEPPGAPSLCRLVLLCSPWKQPPSLTGALTSFCYTR